MNPNYLELENNDNISKTYIGYKKNKIEKQKNNFQYVKSSFTITYIFLLTTATITFIEALRNNSLVVRHVMNLETAISLIAGYFYSTFIQDIKKYEANNKVINWVNISIVRYIDWAMTTPFMLLVLCLVLSHNIQKTVTLKVISGIVILNYIMLYLGYLGEVKYIDRLQSMFFGFIAFFGLFYMIYINYVAPKFVKANYVLFSLYTIIWAFYGIVFMFNEEYKNIAMNILDCISKCLVGIGFWLYFTKIIVV